MTMLENHPIHSRLSKLLSSSSLYSIQTPKKTLLSSTKFLTQGFLKIGSSLSKPIFIQHLKILSIQLGIWIHNGMKQFSRKISFHFFSLSFHNCSQTYWETRHTKPFPYFFMKDYKSGRQDGKARRERNIRELLDERINLYLTYNHRNLDCVIGVQAPNFLSIIYRHIISSDNNRNWIWIIQKYFYSVLIFNNCIS